MSASGLNDSDNHENSQNPLGTSKSDIIKPERALGRTSPEGPGSFKRVTDASNYESILSLSELTFVSLLRMQRSWS